MGNAGRFTENCCVKKGKFFVNRKAGLFLPLFVISACILFLPGCLITMKTARITPVGTNSHTIAAELMSEDWGMSEDMAPNLLYMFRRGISDHFEAGFNVELVNPSIRIGGKFGFTKWCALDLNAGVAMGIFANFFPVFDAAIILGEKGLYGGIKYELFADAGYNPIGALHPFIGYEFQTRGRVRILPELCIGALGIRYRPGRRSVITSGEFTWFTGVGVAF